MTEHFFQSTPKVEIKDFNVLIDGKSCFGCVNKKQIRKIQKDY